MMFVTLFFTFTIKYPHYRVYIMYSRICDLLFPGLAVCNTNFSLACRYQQMANHCAYVRSVNAGEFLEFQLRDFFQVKCIQNILKQSFR